MKKTSILRVAATVTIGLFIVFVSILAYAFIRYGRDFNLMGPKNINGVPCGIGYPACPAGQGCVGYSLPGPGGKEGPGFCGKLP